MMSGVDLLESSELQYLILDIQKLYLPFQLLNLPVHNVCIVSAMVQSISRGQSELFQSSGSPSDTVKAISIQTLCT